MSRLQPPVQVNISSLTIVKILLVVLGLLFMWAIRDIIAMVFVAWVLASALDPFIDRLARWRIPRSLSILTVYLLFIAFVATVVYVLVPPVTTELSSLAKNFPAYYEPIKSALANVQRSGEDAGLLFTLQEALDNTVKNLSSLSSGLYGAVASVFGGIITTIGILVIAFYMTVEEDGIKKFIQSISPVNYQPYITKKLNQIQSKLSSWLWGQILLMVFIGLLSGFALWMLDVKYSLILGLLAGLTEFIPIIGPIIAAIPAAFFALTDFATAPWKFLVVIIVFVVIQQIENQILVPRIMRRAVGVNPVIVIVALLIGAKLGGLIGMLLAVPLVTIIGIFMEDFLQSRRAEQNRLEE